MTHQSTAVSATLKRLSAHFPTREKSRLVLPTHLQTLERFRRFPAETRAFHGLMARIAGSRVAKHARAGVRTARTSWTELFARFARRFDGMAAQGASLRSSASVFLRAFRNLAAFHTVGRSKPPGFSLNTELGAFHALLHNESPRAQRKADMARPHGKSQSTCGHTEAIFRKAVCKAGISQRGIDAPGCVDGYNAMAWCRAVDKEGTANADSLCRAPSAWWRRNRM